MREQVSKTFIRLRHEALTLSQNPPPSRRSPRFLVRPPPISNKSCRPLLDHTAQSRPPTHRSYSNTSQISLRNEHLDTHLAIPARVPSTGSLCGGLRAFLHIVIFVVLDYMAASKIGAPVSRSASSDSPVRAVPSIIPQVRLSDHVVATAMLILFPVSNHSRTR